MVRQVVYHCAAASGTGGSGAENVEAALPPGCVREAVQGPGDYPLVSFLIQR